MRTLGLFLVLNLVLKLALVPLNQAEYTDGILQLTVFENRAGLYPPLYGVLAHLVALSGLNLEWSGRVVSALAGTLALIPVYWTARRLGGEQVARFAALFFTLSPMVLRWSARVMTDALFLVLVAAALYWALEAWEAARRRRDAGEDADVRAQRYSDQRLALAMGTAVLAGLTRYQGVLLLAPLLLPMLAFVTAFRRIPRRTALTVLLWVALPAWGWYGGFVHGGQFADRTAGSIFATATAYWNTAESFVLISPWYFGYPIAVLALVGLVAGIGERGGFARFCLLHGIWAVVILAVQSAFGSFQYRYMLPVLPAVVVLAGGGAAFLERVAASRLQRLSVSGGIMLAVVYLTLFSCAVLVFQRGTFGDQRAAAEWVKENVPPDVPVFSNERYGTFLKLGSVKLSFWSGRKVEFLYRPSYFGGERPVLRDLPPGAIVILGNAYGGDEALGSLLGELSGRYDLRPVFDEPLRVEVVPLLDDVMVNPMYNQNPLAWVVRYVPQRFATQVFRAGAIK